MFKSFQKPQALEGDIKIPVLPKRLNVRDFSRELKLKDRMLGPLAYSVFNDVPEESYKPDVVANVYTVVTFADMGCQLERFLPFDNALNIGMSSGLKFLEFGDIQLISCADLKYEVGQPVYFAMRPVLLSSHNFYCVLNFNGAHVLAPVYEAPMKLPGETKIIFLKERITR